MRLGSSKTSLFWREDRKGPEHLSGLMLEKEDNCIKEKQVEG